MREVDLPMVEDGLVTVRAFVDRSVVEVFANGNRACITGRTYPRRPDSLHVGLYCAGGGIRCEEIDIWQMNSIYGAAGSAESRRSGDTTDRFVFANITDEEREILGWPRS